MALSFPNESRVYSEARHAVHFWGNDSALETSFFVFEDALSGLDPAMNRDVASILDVFDRHRSRIHAAAAKIYRRGERGSYDLVPSDF